MDPLDIPQNVIVVNNGFLGNGSYGDVCKGILKKTGQTVAVKIVQKKGKYKREIEVLKEFQDLEHQHLVRLLDYEDRKNFMVITMEYCPLSDLSKYLNYRRDARQKNHLEEWEIKYFLQQLIEGYNVLYHAKVIHRDLKPQNILLSQSGSDEPTDYPEFKSITLKIADFGLSRFLDKFGKATTEAGTPLYKAPEVSSKSYDYKVDLWSLGIIILEFLIGSKKLLEKASFITTNKWTFALFKPYLTGLNISPELNDLLASLLRRTPSNRIDFDELVRHKFLSMSTEFLKKYEEKARKSNASAQNEVSTSLPQPSTSGKMYNTAGPYCKHRDYSNYGDAREGTPFHYKPFRCPNMGPCDILHGRQYACQLCPICHIVYCERRDPSYFEELREGVISGYCKPCLAPDRGECKTFKLRGGQVICQLCPICHTDHNSNASVLSNVSTLVPQSSSSAMDVSRTVREENN